MTTRTFWKTRMLNYSLCVWDKSEDPDHVFCTLAAHEVGTAICFRVRRPPPGENRDPLLTGFIRALRRIRLTPAGRAMVTQLGLAGLGDSIIEQIARISSAEARSTYGDSYESYPLWPRWSASRSWRQLSTPPEGAR